MELSPKAKEAISPALAKQIEEIYRAVSIPFLQLQQQLEQLDSKIEERFKSREKHKRKGPYVPDMTTFKLDFEEMLARIQAKSKPVTATVREEEEVSHNLYSSHSEFNEVSEPEVSTFTFAHEDTLTSLTAKCDIPSIQTDFVLDTLTSKEPVQPSSIMLVPQVIERKSVEEAQKSVPLLINLEDKRCKPPDRERNQLPRFSSYIFPKEVPPDKTFQRILGTQVSLSCELVHYWNNFTYARVIKQPVLNVEISSIMDLVFPISAKKDTGSCDVNKRLTRAGTLKSLKVDQMEHPNSVLTSIQSSSTLYPSTSMTTENPDHFIQVSNSFSSFISHELKASSMSLIYPRIIEKKLGLFVGRLRQNSYLNMLEKELDDKDKYWDGNAISLLVYKHSMTAIIHLFLVKGIAYIAGVKEEPPDLFTIIVFTRTGIGVDLTKSNTDLRSNLFEEGEDDVSTVSQKREVSSEPELEGRTKLRSCGKQFICLFLEIYSSFQVSSLQHHHFGGYTR